MTGILNYILKENSIYERRRLYKSLINQKFEVTDKIPILYKHNNVNSIREIFKKYELEHNVFEGNFGVLYPFINQTDSILDIKNFLKEDIYFDFSYPIKFSDVNANINSCITELSSFGNLKDSGVVIGFIDTGIDFTLNAFRDEDGLTRIKYIYNPTTDKVYNENEINNALRLENPFELINEVDFKGHGTAVTSVACAGGNIDKNLYGVAPSSKIISVNSADSIDSTETLFHIVMKGLDFLVKKQNEENFPLVINMSFSSNFGPHTGRGIFEDYVRNVAETKNITVVVSAGNEGGEGHHKSGVLKKDGENINLEINGQHKIILISLYKGILSDISIKISSPTSTTSTFKINEGTQTFKLSNDNVSVVFTGANPYNIQGDIQIVISNDKDFITEGIWIIYVTLENEYESEYNMWLPTVESIGKNTKFLSPDNNNTLGIPATVDNVISVGSYDYRTETVSIFSGRGGLNDNYIKPDILAPGEGIRAIYPNGRVSTVSGTSFSAPVVSGICALLMEWGIVKGNKENLYGEVIKYFLVRGAKRKNSINYPNNTYGYGFVCASSSFRDLETTLTNNLRDSNIGDIYGNLEKDNDINLSDLEKINTSICPLEKIYLPDRANFLGVINKNIGDIGQDICVYPLGHESEYEILSLISIPVNKLDDFIRTYFSNPNISLRRSYYYSLCAETVSPLETSGIYQVQNNEYLNLRGQDVIVGIIDTGIDYLNKEFMDELGKTRILEIWDQTIKGEYNDEVLFGTIYKKEQIDKAIELKENGGDPYSIVPTVDTVGHGTAMAGITSARGYGNVRGGAPDSDLVIVKLKEISEEVRQYLDFSQEVQVIYDEVFVYSALRYLKKIKSKYNKPMVVLLPLQTNGGDHSGNSVIEGKITEYSQDAGFVVVVPSGNQANKQIHAVGFISKMDEESLIELFVDRGQRRLLIDIYLENFGKVFLTVISPSGERTQRFELKFGVFYNFKFLFEETTLALTCVIDRNSQEVYQYVEILFDNLKYGLWQIILTSEEEKQLRYSAYLPIKEFLREETRFLNSISDNTITSPSTARLSISMAYFNQNNNSIVAESGQGYTLDGRVAPILAAGGIDILTVGKGGREYLISGSSVSAAVTAGGIALILEWGIARKNRIQMDASIIMWLLISASKSIKDYEFPNKYWGYGILDIRNVFEILK